VPGADCVTTKIWSPTVRVAERASPVFSAAENDTVAGPVPLAVAVEAVNHGALLVTVQEHPLGVATASVPVPPLGGMLRLFGVSSKGQAAPACVILPVTLFTEISACRAPLVGFGAT